MSLAIKFGDVNNPSTVSGFIYLDAVTQYNKSFTGRVTSHPLDAGAKVSDHFISDNPKFSIQGVISGIDFSPLSANLRIDGETPLNVNYEVESVSVNNLHSDLQRILPSSILQFATTQPFTITGGGTRKNYKKEISSLLERLMRGLVYNEGDKRFENVMTPITMYELEGSILTDSYSDLILTSFSYVEEVDNWDALNFQMEFEQVMFVELKNVDAPKTSKRGAQTSTKKGKVTTTAKKVEPVDIKKPDTPRMTAVGSLNKAANPGGN